MVNDKELQSAIDAFWSLSSIIHPKALAKSILAWVDENLPSHECNFIRCNVIALVQRSPILLNAAPLYLMGKTTEDRAQMLFEISLLLCPPNRQEWLQIVLQQ